MQGENSSALARWGSLLRPLRYPLIAASPWSADLTITGELERRGRLRNELGTGFQEQKLVGVGETRNPSSIPPAPDAALMGRSERVAVGWTRRRTAKAGLILLQSSWNTLF